MLLKSHRRLSSVWLGERKWETVVWESFGRERGKVGNALGLGLEGGCPDPASAGMGRRMVEAGSVPSQGRLLP